MTLVHKDDLRSLDWAEYTHLVLVGGNARLPDSLTEQVKGWVADGGTLIATRQAAKWAQDSILRSAEDDANKNDAPKSEKGDPQDAEAETPPERANFGEMRVRDAEHVIGGSIFATDLDITHPLGFGYGDRDLPVHRNTSFTLERPEENPFAVPVQYTDAPLLTGYASQRRLEEIGGTPSVVAVRMSRGTVILMADNPVFRGTYPGTEKLLMNAIFFADLIDEPRADGSD